MHFICIKSLLSATCCSTLLEWRSAVLNQTSVCQANISAALPICNVTFKSNMSLGTYMHVKDGACFKSTFWRLISERAFQAEFPSAWVEMVWGIDPCASPSAGVCSVCYFSFTQRLLLCSQPPECFLDQIFRVMSFLQILPGLREPSCLLSIFMHCYQQLKVQQAKFIPPF